MTSKIVLALIIVIATTTAVPTQSPGMNWPATGSVNPWIPSWKTAKPWIPQWTPCTVIGSTCFNCSTKLVCTKVGEMQKTCADPKMPYCNMGKCSATPTAECAPSSPAEEPTSTASA